MPAGRRAERNGVCEDAVLRIMSFLEEATGKELVLPVTPAKYFWRHPNAVETVRLDQLGEITLPGGVKMGDCTLEDVLLPAQLYPFCVPGARAAPYEYLYDLEVWSDKAAKLRWIVSGTSVNASVILEEITQGEQDGTNDLYVTIVMRQWRKPETPVLAVSGSGAQTDRDTQGRHRRGPTRWSPGTACGASRRSFMAAGPNISGWRRPTRPSPTPI